MLFSHKGLDSFFVFQIQSLTQQNDIKPLTNETPQTTGKEPGHLSHFDQIRKGAVKSLTFKLYFTGIHIRSRLVIRDR